MRQKGFAPIIILILLILVAGGVYYFGSLALTLKKEGSSDKNNVVQVNPAPTQVAPVQPTSKSADKITIDPVTGWKVFTNEKLIYSISFPANFEGGTTWEKDTGDITGFRIEKIVTEPTGPDVSYIGIAVSSSQQSASNNYDAYLNMNVGETKEVESLTHQSVTRLADTRIGSVLTKSYINKQPWESTGPAYLYIFEYKGSLYVITEALSSDDVSKKLLDQILSTFKFTQ